MRRVSEAIPVAIVAISASMYAITTFKLGGSYDLSRVAMACRRDSLRIAAAAGAGIGLGAYLCAGCFLRDLAFVVMGMTFDVRFGSLGRIAVAAVGASIGRGCSLDLIAVVSRCLALFVGLFVVVTCLRDNFDIRIAA